MDTVELWVDGSFTPQTNQASWGYLIVSEGQKIHENSGIILNEETNRSRQVGGELAAVLNGLQWIIEEQPTVKTIIIYYDYEGVEKWATREWEAKKKLTRQYRDKIAEVTKLLVWRKVKAHSGNKWNEAADRLAKKEQTIAVDQDVKIFKFSPSDKSNFADITFRVSRSLFDKNSFLIEYYSLVNGNENSIVIQTMNKTDGIILNLLPSTGTGVFKEYKTNGVKPIINAIIIAIKFFDQFGTKTTFNKHVLAAAPTIKKIVIQPDGVLYKLNPLDKSAYLKYVII